MTAPQPPRASAKSARRDAVRQAAERVITPTGLRILGLAGSLLLCLAGHRAVGLLGAAVLGAAWLGVDRFAAGRPLRWRAATAALWAVPLLVSPPLFSRDSYAYACQGQLLVHGLRPYQHGVADLPCTWLTSVPTLWWHTAAPYGPLWLALSGGAAAAGGGHLAVVVGLLRLVAVIGLLLTIGYGYRLAGMLGVDPARATWLAALSPLMLLHGVSGTHNDALLAGLVLGALATAHPPTIMTLRTDSPGVSVRNVMIVGGWRTGVLLGLAIAVKVTAVVAVPFAILLIARDGRWRAIARATAPVAAALVGTFAAVTLATGLGLGWLPALSGTAGLIQWTSPPTGVGMAAGYLLRAAGRPDLAPVALAGARAVGLAVLAAGLVALWFAARRRATQPRAVVLAAGAALAATALLSPVFFPWYALVPLAVLGCCPMDERTRRRLALGVLGLALLVLPDGTGLAALTKPVGAFADLVLVSVLVIWAARRYLGHRARPRPTPR